MTYSQKISDEKAQMREKALQIASALSPENGSIAKKVLQTKVWANAKNVFCYVSYGYEPNTHALINDALFGGKRLFVPLCKKGGIMSAIEIKSESELKKGFYGILEPPENNPKAAPDEIDLVILPCLAADKENRRLGKGGGYYDRFLSKCKPNCVKLLVCRHELLFDVIPCDSHDIAADMLIF